MTSKTHRYATIVCEGCGQVHGQPDQYAEVAQARSGALLAGWRLVPRTRTSGRPAYVTTDPTDLKALKQAASTSHDVCPACLSAFTPEACRLGGMTGKKPWQTQRIERLEAEVAKLRGGRP